MRIQFIVIDPAPDAERGTLEYAASAAACQPGFRIECNASELRAIAHWMALGAAAEGCVSELAHQMRRALRGEDS